MFVGTRASGDPAHANFGSSIVECVVVRTPRRVHQRRLCLCSRAHHNVVRRGPTFGGNDRKNVAMTPTVNSTCWASTHSKIEGVAAINGERQRRRQDIRSRSVRWWMSRRQALTNHSPGLSAEGDWCCSHSRLKAGTAQVFGPAVSHNLCTLLGGQEAADTADHHSQWEGSDTESVVSLSGSAGPDLVEVAQEVIEEEPQLAVFRVSEALRDALVSWDDVNVETESQSDAVPTKVLGRRTCQQCHLQWKKFARVDAPTTILGGSAVGSCSS